MKVCEIEGKLLSTIRIVPGLRSVPSTPEPGQVFGQFVDGFSWCILGRGIELQHGRPATAPITRSPERLMRAGSSPWAIQTAEVSAA